MKLLVSILMAIGIVQAAFAQTTPDKSIVLPATVMSIKDAIREVKDQSSFTFTYSNRVDVSAKVTFSSTRLSVRQILETIRLSTGVTSRVNGPKIILRPPVKRHTINGYLRDGQSGESLIGGNIYTVPDLHGTTTNTFGHFSLTLPEGTINLMASYVGYEPITATLTLTRDTTLDLTLKSTQLQEVIVIADVEKEPIHELTQMSTITMPVQQLKALPAMAGEVDIMKSLSLLPGVQTGSEGSTGLYVRGGGPDQNLILLDGVPVYNASHLFGFFSVFNADAINHVELIKGGFPARYGGRLSSVIDISMKEGNKEKLKGEGSIGIIGSKLTLEGPLQKDKATFIVSARRTYIDLLARPFLSESFKQGYYFYDLNGKVNYKFNKRNRLYFSVYSGRDNAYTESQPEQQPDANTDVTEKQVSDVGWGNRTAALRWNNVISPKLFSNLSVTYNRYAFSIFNSNELHSKEPDGSELHRFYKNRYSSGITDYSAKLDIDFLPTSRQYIKVGVYGTHHTFTPGVTTTQNNTDDEPVLNGFEITTTEFGGYLEDDINIGQKLKANVGVHLSGYKVNDASFMYPQPRVALRYLVNPKFSIKASYATMAQYVHLLTNAGVGLPTDLWVPATEKIKPQRSMQGAAGIAWSPNDTYELVAEGYYKTMDGVIEYKEGASYLNSEEEWQDKVESGRGQSYGGEVMLQKKLGRWTGWVGYTLSWTYRQFDNINGGKKFPYRYDRRHDIEIVVNRALTKKIDFASTWVYGTGNAISLPVGEYSGAAYFPQVWADIFYNNLLYEGRNAFRLRAYHRLDLSVSFKKQKRWGERSWVISFYNAYSRRNPFYVGFRPDQNGNKALYQYSLFPIIPSIAYNFKF